MVTTTLHLNGKEVGSIRTVAPPTKGQEIEVGSDLFLVTYVSEVTVLHTLGNFATAIVRRIQKGA